MIVEKRSLRAITSRAVPREERLVRREQSARLLENAGSRADKADAPEAVRPSGEYASVEEGKAAFLASRARIREYVAPTEDDLDSACIDASAFGRNNVLRMGALLLPDIPGGTPNRFEKSGISNRLEQPRLREATV